jgi:hypothetical protein
MTNSSSITIETTPSLPDERRKAFFLKARQERSAWAREVAPEAMAQFEEAAEKRRVRP